VTDPTEIPGQEPTRSRAQALSERYGTDRPRRRGLAGILGGVVAAALLAWVIWAVWPGNGPAIEATVTSYDVVSTHEVQIKVSAQFRDSDSGGNCLFRATAEDHTIVGELNLTAAELRAAQGEWIPIRTERRATTATLVRCTD
jgi:hypothetical protein